MRRDESTDSEDDFRERLRARIELSATTARSLVDLVRGAQGAYPTLVREVAVELDRMQPGVLPASALTYEPVLPHLTASESALPIPHPLDFDWRFADDGCRRLAAEVAQAGNGRVRRSVALLGTPSFAERLPSLVSSAVDAALFERSADACAILPLQHEMDVIPGDVAATAGRHGGRFGVALADPPWYTEMILTFVSAAAVLLAPGGVLLICVPGPGTRPGIVAEVAGIIAEAEAQGLTLIGHLPEVVTYESPPFELAALSAANLPAFDPYWRRADLLKFTKVGSPRRPLHPQSTTPSSDSWEEVAIGRARIRVHRVSLGTEPPLLTPVVPGEVLDSVSGRDPRRSSANVWTTTNRVFQTPDPIGLLDSLRRIAAGSAATERWASEAGQLVTAELGWLRHFGVE